VAGVAVTAVLAFGLMFALRRLAGLPVAPEHLQEIRRRVGIVFQDPDDQLFMPTVRDDVAFGPANLGVRGAELEARVQEALDAVGMTDVVDRPPHHLSFGQRRRVAVATVLASAPTCWCWTSRHPTSTPPPAGSWPRCWTAWTSPC
jgi:energy-coupling factor transporter ATP-binding protein EcfA2